MSRKTSLSVGVHRALSGVAITTTALMVPALSQAQAQDQQTPSDLEQIVVTGSRIATNANLVSSSPVTQIKAEEFQYRGITRVEDLINTLPQVTPEFSSTTVNGATGTATLDLRGLQSNRTLTLVNGHRMGFGDPFVLAPDVNQIPGSLVDRVEILTGGASSTYGSDAVAGVVNFIMKDDFEGFQLDYQYAGYQHSQSAGNVQQAVADSGFVQAPDDVTDGGTTNVTVTMGVNTDDGRGNITAYMGYRNIHPILQSQRDFSACALDAASADYTCAGSSTNAEGRFTDFGVILPILAPDEDAAGLGAPTFDFHVANGDQFVPGVPLYNYGPLNYFQRPDERFVGGLFGHFQVDEHLDAYTEFMFMDDHSVAQIAPSGAFFVTSSINCANPLLSAQQHAAICGNDRVIDDEAVPGFDPETAASFVPGVDPRSVGIQSCDSRPDLPCPLYIGRRSIEGGPRQSDLRHTSFRLLVGARGDLSDNWSYDVYANFSRLVFRQVYLNDMSTTRIKKSLDVVPDPVTGEAVCRSTLLGLDPNCVPWNVFQEGGVTQEALDYLVLPLFANADLDADRAVGFINGDLSDLGLVTPWSSEGVKVVLGGTYGHESMDFNPDIGFRTGDGAGQGGPTAAVAGVRNVKELFTEFRIPIADDLPWAESLALNLRYRYSDYSTGSTTDTYNIGGAWSPVETVKFRGGFSRAVRAPSIRELFAPQSLGLWGGTDPCAGPTPELTSAECTLTGVTGSQYGHIPLSPAGQYNQIAGGNPDLIPETADTVTVGAVFTPDELVPGLTFSIDYWSIKVEDAIDTIDPEFLINACGTSGDPALCGLINRGPNGNLWVGSSGTDALVVSTNVNIGFFEVTGYDLTANYGMEIGGMGGLDLSFRGTWLDQFDQQPVPGADIDDCAGVFGGSCNRPRPQWKHTFNAVWTTPWDTTITGGWRYVGEISEFDTDRFTADAENYIDLSATYNADWFGEGTTLTAGITNVFDNDPPISGLFGNVGTFGNGNTIPGVWDSLGRYYFVGFTQNF